MPKEIIIDNGRIVNATDYKAKAEKIIEELGNSVFSQFEAEKKKQELDNKVAEIFNEEKDTEKANKPQKFYRNQINPVLTPMQVTAKLNRLLRVYKPLSQADAETIPDTEYLEAFGYYCDIISYINDYLVYMPSKQSLCSFMNITVDIYNNFLSNPNYQQVFKSFEDSLVDFNFNSAQAGIVDGKVTVAKLQTKEAGHNLIKNDDAVVQNNYLSIDKQQVNLKLSQFEAMTKQIGNKGK